MAPSNRWLLRNYPRFLACLCWCTLIILLGLYIASEPRTVHGLARALFRFFTFFTVQANILVALAVTAFALHPRSNHQSFFARPATMTAIATYILMVDIIFALFLRPPGYDSVLSAIVDTLLHDIIAPAYLLLWLLCVPKGRLRYRQAFLWLLYPIAFLPFNALTSAFAHHNPYHFLDISTVGYARFLLVVAAFMIAFVVLGFLLIGLDHLIARILPPSSEPMPLA